MTDDLRQWIIGMPKAELHVHLEGTMDPATLLTLANRYDRVADLPGDDLDAVRRWMVFSDFNDFIEKYLLIVDLLRSEEDFALLVEACGRDMHEQGIRYREITVTPFLHTASRHHPLAFETLISGLEAGRVSAKEHYDVEMRWVFDVPRNASFIDYDPKRYDPLPATKTLEYALRAIDHGCIGFGLGGSEVNAPPEPFEHGFVQAKQAGLLSVPHAGETGGPQSIWGALRQLRADRIGHGVRAVEDPELLTYLSDRQIPLEVNITSNICLHIYDTPQSHPFAMLDGMGLLLTINSDDPPLFDTTLVDEYVLVHDALDYDQSSLARIARNAFASAGIEESIKRSLLTEFDGWMAANAPAP